MINYLSYNLVSIIPMTGRLLVVAAGVQLSRVRRCCPTPESLSVPASDYRAELQSSLAGWLTPLCTCCMLQMVAVHFTQYISDMFDSSPE